MERIEIWLLFRRELKWMNTEKNLRFLLLYVYILLLSSLIRFSMHAIALHVEDNF